MSTRELPGSLHSLYELGDRNLRQNVQSCANKTLAVGFRILLAL